MNNLVRRIYFEPEKTETIRELQLTQAYESATYGGAFARFAGKISHRMGEFVSEEGRRRRRRIESGEGSKGVYTYFLPRILSDERPLEAFRSSMLADGVLKAP